MWPSHTGTWSGVSLGADDELLSGGRVIGERVTERQMEVRLGGVLVV